MSQPEKQCTQCLAFKPLGEFGNDKNKKDGKKTACRCCTNEYARQYRAANPEKVNESQRKYSAANPEKCKEADRRSKTAARHARNQCAVFNAQDPKKWELLQSKLKALDSTKTKEKE